MTNKQQAVLIESENEIRTQLEQIVHCKEIGIKQETINKMIVMIQLKKFYFDKMKVRFENNGK